MRSCFFNFILVIISAILFFGNCSVYQRLFFVRSLPASYTSAANVVRKDFNIFGTKIFFTRIL
jgi:hypothetical protein